MEFIENFKEWMYRKKYIQAWPLLESLAEASCIINPKFILVDDFVFLDCGNENLYFYNSN